MDKMIETVTEGGVILPTQRKAEGGTHFDDELETKEHRAKAYAEAVTGLPDHLAQRPDHIVYVGSGDERTKLREVFNWWYKHGALTYHPTIRIDYGVADGAIRVGDGR